MTITYKDSLGIVSVDIDVATGVSFCNGRAYFTTGDLQSDCVVPVENIVSITRF